MRLAFVIFLLLSPEAFAQIATQSATQISRPDLAAPNSREFSYSAELQELTYKTENDEDELHTKFSIQNLDRKTNEYDASIQQRYDRKVDAFDKSTVTEETENLKSDYNRKKIYENVGYANHFEFKRSKHNAVFEDKYNVSIAPVGVKYDILQNETITSFSLSYLPIFNYIEAQTPAVNPFTGESIAITGIERSLQNSVRLILNTVFSDKKLSLNFETWFKWVKVINGDIEGPRSVIFTNEINLSYQLTTAVSIGALNKADFDPRRAAQGLAVRRATSTLKVAYTF